MIQAKVRPLSNQEIMAINDEIYNRFWRKYRDSIAGNRSEERRVGKEC